MRLCGDFKVTVNPALNIAQYPLPRIEDILATLGGSTLFSIDLRLAYLQMELDDESKKLATIHTNKGLYRYITDWLLASHLHLLFAVGDRKGVGRFPKIECFSGPNFDPCTLVGIP